MQGLWTGAAVPSASPPPVGPTSLAVSLAWEGVVEEEVQAGRGVWVDEAYVHPLQYLVTKNLPGIPPYFPNFEIYHDPLQSPRGHQPPPCPPPPVPVGVHGEVRPF